MSGVLGYVPRLAVLIDGLEMTPDAVNQARSARSYASAHHGQRVAVGCYPEPRTVETQFRDRPRATGSNAGRSSRTRSSAISRLLTAHLASKFDAGTHVYWHGDENHTRGGYRSIFVEPGASALSEAKSELALLRDTVLAAVSAAKALEHADLLADKE